jgi:signal transduction histidine kinase
MVGSKRKDVEIRVNASYRGQLRWAGTMMLQVLVNLIDNATQAAGANGWVEITTTREGDDVLIDVSDNGTGVPPQLRERIFEPFFTTKAPGLGTGLGLSTSRQIVEQHHGTLRVVDGTTSTFRISLPRNGPSTDIVAMTAATSS